MKYALVWLAGFLVGAMTASGKPMSWDLKELECLHVAAFALFLVSVFFAVCRITYEDGLVDPPTTPVNPKSKTTDPIEKDEL